MPNLECVTCSILFVNGLSRFLFQTLLFLCVQAGDKVVYSKYAGTEVAVDGADYVLLKVTSKS